MTFRGSEQTAGDGSPSNKPPQAARLSDGAATRTLKAVGNGGMRGSSRRRWVLLIVMLILVPVVGFVGYNGWQIIRAMNIIYQPPKPLPELPGDITPSNTPQPQPTSPPGEATYTPLPTLTPLPTATEDPADPLPPGRINILVLGTDKRSELQQDSSRSDTLIVVSIDPQAKTAGILSIPRDLRVKIRGYGENKINAAYFFGELYDVGTGPSLAMDTVSNYFHIPLKYYLAINFEGFQKVVDTLGGISVYNPSEITDTKYPDVYNGYKTVHFDAGCLNLDGETALEYARTRHADSDFGRALRQQQVILAVRNKALKLEHLLPSFSELVSEFGDMIETSIPPDQQFALVQVLSQIKREDIYTAQIDASMVTTAPDGTDDLILDWDKAEPMLDWFFGRGDYAALKPGTTLTSTPEPTATPTRTLRRTPTLTLTPTITLTPRAGRTYTATPTLTSEPTFTPQPTAPSCGE